MNEQISQLSIKIFTFRVSDAFGINVIFIPLVYIWLKQQLQKCKVVAQRTYRLIFSRASKPIIRYLNQYFHLELQCQQLDQFIRNEKRNNFPNFLTLFSIRNLFLKVKCISVFFNSSNSQNILLVSFSSVRTYNPGNIILIFGRNDEDCRSKIQNYKKLHLPLHIAYIPFN